MARCTALVVPLSVTVRGAARRRGAARGGAPRSATGDRDQRAASRGRVSALGSAHCVRCPQRTRGRPSPTRRPQPHRARGIPDVSKWTGDVVPALRCDICSGRIVLGVRYSTRPCEKPFRVTEAVMHALRSPQLIVTAVLVLGAVACGKGSKSPPPAPPAAARRMPAGPAEYTVIIKRTWTKKKHPFEHPSAAPFSGMIRASHNAKYSIFTVGRRPTPGLERLSEEGKHSPLDTEIRGAIDQGKDRKSIRLNSSHGYISYAVFCL